MSEFLARLNINPPQWAGETIGAWTAGCGCTADFLNAITGLTPPDAPLSH